MAGPRICRSLHYNPPPGGEDKFVRDPPRTPTKDNNTPTTSPTVSRAQTPAPTVAPAPAPPSDRYTDVDL